MQLLEESIVAKSDNLIEETFNSESKIKRCETYPQKSLRSLCLPPPFPLQSMIDSPRPGGNAFCPLIGDFCFLELVVYFGKFTDRMRIKLELEKLF